MPRSAAAALVLWTAIASAAPVPAQTLPKPTGRVSDAAGLLAPATRDTLESLLTTLEKDTSAEVVVATTTSLGGRSVEEYGTTVFNEWHLGKAGVDNGVLVLVAPKERKMRIEVGYGLERVISNQLAESIIRDDFLPQFRDGHYEAGILAGVRHVADVIRAHHAAPEPLEAVGSSARSPAPAASRSPETSSPPGVFLWIVFATFALMWLAGVGMAGAMFGQGWSLRSGPNLIFGIVAVGIFAGVPISFLPGLAVVLAPIALAGGAWGYLRRPLGGGRSGSTSTWDWTVSSGSSTSDSSSSSSSSSDSGGSSGGGGASGSW